MRAASARICRQKRKALKEAGAGHGADGKTPAVGLRERGGNTVAMTVENTDVGSWGPLDVDFAVVGNRLDLADADVGWVGFDGQFRGTRHEAVTGSFRWESTETGNLTAAFGGGRR